MEDMLSLVLFISIFELGFFGLAIKRLQEHERGVIFRLGRFMGVYGPGLSVVVPIIDRMVKVDLRLTTLDIPSQAYITHDRVKVNVSAALHYQVTDPQRAIVNVEDFRLATRQAAQINLGNVVGQYEMNRLLAQREQVNEQLQALVDEQAKPWGVKVSRVEIKDLEIV